MTRALAAAAALLLASCYEPAGQCTADTDCLSSQVCGPDKLCVTGTRPPLGNPPVGVADTYASFAGRGPFDVSAVAGVLHNDTDPTGATLTAELVSAPQYGTLYLAPDGSFTYVPVANFNGSDGFTYRATNGTLVSADTAVAMTVFGPPIAVADAYPMSLAAGATLTVVAPGVLANDTDPNTAKYGPLTAQLVTAPANGVLALASDGSFTYTPNAAFTAGTDTFTYVAKNGTLVSDPTPARITVGP